MSVVLRPARSTDAGKLGSMITEAAGSRPWKPRLHSGAEDIAHAGAMIENGWVTVAEASRTGALLGFLAREGAYIHAW
ncbi:MAG: GNAT family N-acetyltransferase, partial [Rhodobacteraceae bacterium]